MLQSISVPAQEMVKTNQHKKVFEVFIARSSWIMAEREIVSKAASKDVWHLGDVGNLRAHLSHVSLSCGYAPDEE